VEADAYLLHVSRYIHRNPLEAGFTEPLECYRWSSYAAYVQCVCPEPWLQHHRVWAMAGGSPQHYGAFVQQAGDRDVDAFYARRHLKPILGGAAFMAQATQDLDVRHLELADARRLQVPPHSGADCWRCGSVKCRVD